MLKNCFQRAIQVQRQNMIINYQVRMFSQYWKDQDKAAFIEFNSSFSGSKAYTRAKNLWEVPLAKKAAKRERKLQNPPAIVPPNPRGIVYVHNEEKGVSLPNNPEQIFAVVNIKGS